eukprot:gene11653-17974_t
MSAEQRRARMVADLRAEIREDINWDAAKRQRRIGAESPLRRKSEDEGRAGVRTNDPVKGRRVTPIPESKLTFTASGLGLEGGVQLPHGGRAHVSSNTDQRKASLWVNSHATSPDPNASPRANPRRIGRQANDESADAGPKRLKRRGLTPSNTYDRTPRSSTPNDRRHLSSAELNERVTGRRRTSSVGSIGPALTAHDGSSHKVDPIFLSPAFARLAPKVFLKPKLTRPASPTHVGQNILEHRAANEWGKDKAYHANSPPRSRGKVEMPARGRADSVRRGKRCSSPGMAEIARCPHIPSLLVHDNLDGSHPPPPTVRGVTYLGGPPPFTPPALVAKPTAYRKHAQFGSRSDILHMKPDPAAAAGATTPRSSPFRLRAAETPATMARFGAASAPATAAEDSPRSRGRGVFYRKHTPTDPITHRHD